AHRGIRDAAVERAHTDERERAGIDVGRDEQLCRAAECAADEAAERERRAKVARAAAGAERQRGREDFHRHEREEEAHAPPPGRDPIGARDRSLRRAISAPEDADPAPREVEVRVDEDDPRGRSDAEAESAEARPHPRPYRNPSEQPPAPLERGYER